MSKKIKINVEDLIPEIFKRSDLWNQKAKNYHNRLVVEKSSKAIDETLQIPSEFYIYLYLLKLNIIIYEYI